MHETTKASIRTGEEGSRLLRDDKNCNYANWLRNIGIYVSRERDVIFRIQLFSASGSRKFSSSFVNKFRVKNRFVSNETLYVRTRSAARANFFLYRCFEECRYPFFKTYPCNLEEQTCDNNPRGLNYFAQ